MLVIFYRKEEKKSELCSIQVHFTSKSATIIEDIIEVVLIRLYLTYQFIFYTIVES